MHWARRSAGTTRRWYESRSTMREACRSSRVPSSTWSPDDDGCGRTSPSRRRESTRQAGTHSARARIQQERPEGRTASSWTAFRNVLAWEASQTFTDDTAPSGGSGVAAKSLAQGRTRGSPDSTASDSAIDSTHAPRRQRCRGRRLRLAAVLHQVRVPAEIAPVRSKRARGYGEGRRVVRQAGYGRQNDDLRAEHNPQRSM